MQYISHYDTNDSILKWISYNLFSRSQISVALYPKSYFFFLKFFFSLFTLYLVTWCNRHPISKGASVKILREILSVSDLHWIPNCDLWLSVYWGHILFHCYRYKYFHCIVITYQYVISLQYFHNINIAWEVGKTTQIVMDLDANVNDEGNVSLLNAFNYMQITVLGKSTLTWQY